MEPIIEVTGISKKYTIAHQRGGYVALRDVLASVFMRPFSFLKQKVKRAIGLETKETFWALKDINFTVQKGEIIGIIGKNGAGKSTLLKILSQITPPTTGEIKIHGRVGSLLEVGTGFHPELTGRENIFLNGAILGMTKKEIATKFNEIVTFAGIEQFLDTPVKYYSSGMYVRLAFSVAAHMEPDILIVDEVLAVGDAEFQKKCLGKMEEVTKNQGRTILFVSHNLQAIKELCTRCILMENGQIKEIGATDSIITSYTKETHGNTINKRSFIGPLSNFLEFTKITINESENPEVQSDEKINIKIQGTAREDIDNAQITLSVYRGDIRLFSLFDTNKPENIKKGYFESIYEIEPNILRGNNYSIALGAHTIDNKWVYGVDVGKFIIISKFSDSNKKDALGIINIPHKSKRNQ